MSKLLSELPVGAKVKAVGSKFYDKDLVFRVLGPGHSQDPANSVILQTNDIISARCFDAKEPNNSNADRRDYGNNRYLHSNLLQWLNSDAGANAWYSAKHAADQKPDSANVWQYQYQSVANPVNPYDTQAGFMNGFTSDFKNSLLTVTKRTAKNTVTDGGGYEDVQSKFFLLSTTEVGLANENNVAEGERYSFFSSSKKRTMVVTQECANNSVGYPITAGYAWGWLLRTPSFDNSRNVRAVSTDGNLDYTRAYYGDYGLAPACALSKNQKVSDTPDEDGCYEIVFSSAPVITTPSTDLGNKIAGFSFDYSITDADVGDTITANIKLDGNTVISNYTVDQTQTYTCTLSNLSFNNLTLGIHTYTITATDSTGNISTLDIVFSKVSKEERYTSKENLIPILQKINNKIDNQESSNILVGTQEEIEAATIPEGTIVAVYYEDE